MTVEATLNSNPAVVRVSLWVAYRYIAMQVHPVQNAVQ